MPSTLGVKDPPSAPANAGPSSSNRLTKTRPKSIITLPAGSSSVIATSEASNSPAGASDSAFPYSFDVSAAPPGPERRASLRSSSAATRPPSQYSSEQERAGSSAKLLKSPRSRPTSSLAMTPNSANSLRPSSFYPPNTSLSRNPSSASARRTSKDLDEIYRGGGAGSKKGRKHDPEFKMFDTEMAPHLQRQRAREGFVRVGSIASSSKTGGRRSSSFGRGVPGFEARRSSATGLLAPGLDDYGFGKSWSSGTPLGNAGSALDEEDSDELSNSDDQQYLDAEDDFDNGRPRYDPDAFITREGDPRRRSSPADAFAPPSSTAMSTALATSIIANHSPFSYASPARRYSKASDSGYGGTATGTMSPSSPMDGAILSLNNDDSQLLPRIDSEEEAASTLLMRRAPSRLGRDTSAELDAFTGKNLAALERNPGHTVAYDEAGMPIITPSDRASRRLSKRQPGQTEASSVTALATSSRPFSALDEDPEPSRVYLKANATGAQASSRYTPSKLQSNVVIAPAPSPSSSSSSSIGGIKRKRGPGQGQAKKKNRRSKLMGLPAEMADQLLGEEENPFKQVLVSNAGDQQTTTRGKLTKRPNGAKKAVHMLGRDEEKARAEEFIEPIVAPSIVNPKDTPGMRQQPSSRLSKPPPPPPPIKTTNAVDELAAFTGGKALMSPVEEKSPIVAMASAPVATRKRRPLGQSGLKNETSAPEAAYDEKTGEHNRIIGTGGGANRQNSQMSAVGSVVSGRESGMNAGSGLGRVGSGVNGYIPSQHGRTKSLRPGVAVQDDYTPGCSDAVKRSLQSITLTMRFGAFRTKKKIQRRANKYM